MNLPTQLNVEEEKWATVHKALRHVSSSLDRNGVEHPILNAEQLLCSVLSCGRTHLYIDPNRSLNCTEATALREALELRLRHRPLQYITGSSQFLTFDLQVNEAVFIPRPETEILVESAIRKVGEGSSGRPAPILVDLCTGSGNIAMALARAFPHSRVCATDISEQALAVARGNAATHHLSDRIVFLQGDLFDPLYAFDVKGRAVAIICNPPYIVRSQIGSLPPEVRDHEPRIALDGGDDGLDIIRRIIREAPAFLKITGLLALEVGLGQASAVKALLTEYDCYKDIEIVKDLSGIDRILMASYKGTRGDS